MKVETKLITPEYASILLGNNDNNRALSLKIAKQYAEEMKAGNWQLNGDAIRIDINGKLLDGQHRLKACILSGISLETLIITGLPKSTFKTMDTGKATGTADSLKISGYSYTSCLASASRFTKKWLLGERNINIYNGGVRKFSNTVMLEFVSLHPNLETCCQICSTDYARITRQLGYGVAAGCFYLFNRKDPKLAVEFFTRLTDGINLESGDLILGLRDKLSELSAEKFKVMQGQKALILIQVWNRLRKNETKGKVVMHNVNELPEIN